MVQLKKYGKKEWNIMPKKCILVMDVDDEFGVLTRITGRIRREGLNIAELSVAQTSVAGISRMTIRVELRGIPVEQVISRLARFDCVKDIHLCEEGASLVRELVFIRCYADSPLCIGKPFLQQSGNTVCFEKTGTPQELDAYLQENRSQIDVYKRQGKQQCLYIWH